jgi:hypothetical protein
VLNCGRHGVSSFSASGAEVKPSARKNRSNIDFDRNRRCAVQVG